MDVLHFIKSYHDEVKAAIDGVAHADGVKSRRARLDELSHLVQVYVDLERDYLYPEIADLFPGAETLVKIGEANGATLCRRVKALIKLVAKPAAEQDGFEKRFEELRGALVEHYDNEEQVLMPKIRMMIRTEDREDLGQVFLDARDELVRGQVPAVTVSTGSRKRA